MTKAGRGTRLILGSSLLGIALAFLAVLLTWVDQRYGSDNSGLLSRNGYQAAPAVVPLALVALAGLVAVFAGRGAVGRIIGGLLTADGLALAVAGATLLVDPPANAAGGSSLPAPAELMGPVQTHPAGPVLVVLAGLLVLIGGAAAAGGAAGRRLGSRFDAPGRSTGALPADAEDADAAAAWWKALDNGGDPTAVNTSGRQATERTEFSDRSNELPQTTGGTTEALSGPGESMQRHHDSDGAVSFGATGQLP